MSNHSQDRSHQEKAEITAIKRQLETPIPASDANGSIGFMLENVRERIGVLEKRQVFLADAARLLSSSLDYHTTLNSVAQSAVPALADWCAVDIVAEPSNIVGAVDGMGLREGTAAVDGKPTTSDDRAPLIPAVLRLAIAHVDPERVEWAKHSREIGEVYRNPDCGVLRVLQTGESAFYPYISDEMLVQSTTSQEQLAAFRSLRLISTILVPMNARGRTLGVISFITTEDSGRRYAEDDFSLAKELAQRAAIAVDNARLYEEMRSAVERHARGEEKLSLLAEASETLLSSGRVKDLQDAILDLSRRLLMADAYALWRQDTVSGVWRAVVNDGLSEQYKRSIVPSGSAMPDLSEPLVINNTECDEVLSTRREAYNREGIRSVMILPLRVHGRTSGTLAVYHRKPYTFEPGEIRIAKAMASLVAASLGITETYEEESELRSRAETEVKERIRIEAALRESEMRYRFLADSMAQVVWISLADGRIEYANQRWFDYVGAPQGAADLRWFDGIHPADLSRCITGWQEAVRGDRTWEGEYRLMRGADRTYRWHLGRAVPVRMEGETVRWFGTATDIDEQKLSEEMQRFLAQLAERVDVMTDPADILWQTVKLLGKHLKASRCGYAYVKPEADQMTIDRDYCVEAESICGTYSPAQYGPETASSLAHGQTVVVSDTRTDPRTASRYKELFDPYSILSFIDSPIMKDGRHVATLTVQQVDKPRDWTVSEVDLVKTVSERTGLLAENVRLRRAADEAQERQQAMLREMLSHVTDGKLRLCASPSELPGSLPEEPYKMTLNLDSGTAPLRAHVTELAKHIAFSTDRVQELVTAVSEAAMNAIVHGCGGLVEVSRSNSTVQCRILDHGPGIAIENLSGATLRHGFTTAGTLGHGMKMMLQTADRIWLLTGPTGTSIVLELDLTPPALPWV